MSPEDDKVEPSDRELLARILAGSVSRADPAVRARLDASPELRRSLAAMQVTAEDLAAIAEVMRDDPPDAPDIDVEALIAAHGVGAHGVGAHGAAAHGAAAHGAGAHGAAAPRAGASTTGAHASGTSPSGAAGPRPMSARRGGWLALAAAALVAVGIGIGVWLRTTAGAGDDFDPMLGGARDPAMHPADEPLQAGEAFRWTEVPGADYYRVQLRGVDGQTLTPDPEIVRPQWLPSETTLESLPREFRWRVQAFDGSDQLLRVGDWVSATLAGR